MRAAHGEQRRRIVNGGKSRGVIRLAECKERDPVLLRGFDFAFRILTREHLDGAICAAAAREVGQRFQCRTSAAEMIHELAEGSRSDILGTYQSEPVQPLRIGERRPD
jgi:hypothetical protein